MALTAQEQAELDSLRAEIGSQSPKPKPKAGLSAQEQSELDSLRSELTPKTEEPGLGSKALDYGLRGLDYAGGLTRTGAADLADTVMGGGHVTGDDWKKALHGKSPSSADYMDKLGVPEGAHVDLNPFAEGDSSVRDIGGFIGDVALDPLTYASLGTSALEKKGLSTAAKVFDTATNPIGKALEGAGKMAYKSGFKKVDEALAEKGMKELSQVMLENGRPAGTIKQLSKEADKILEDKMAKRGQIYNRINDAGEKVSVSDAMIPALESGAEIVHKSPGSDDQVMAMIEWLKKYGREGDNIPVDLASDWKSSLYNSMPSSAYDPNGRMLATPKKIQQQFARGFKEQIEAAGERTGKGLGGELSSLNEDVGSILGSRKPLAREVRKANTKNMVSPIDSGMSAYAMIDPTGTGKALLAAKKVGDLAKTTWARTKAGNAMMKSGESELVDPVIRRMLIDSNQEGRPRSRWQP